MLVPFGHGHLDPSRRRLASASTTKAAAHPAVPPARITVLRLRWLLLRLTTRNSMGASGTVGSGFGGGWQDRLLVYQ